MRTLPLSPNQDASSRPLKVVSMKTASAQATTAVRRIASQALLEGARELVIEHEGSEYHLRLTRNDKLILTK
jgi:hemin uptake protein HemP